ncbi:hypothetical protein CVT24_010508 [Panaeolus cyanescens]|uniref:Uncharacterized protein n=1 Tax=Panaeolus cyanescens TaxID=181874 RepID=A0A409YLW8_9AGAR|nr:hypothetical protein CVT24_010508 [Panaeolus cyanescens]
MYARASTYIDYGSDNQSEHDLDHSTTSLHSGTSSFDVFGSSLASLETDDTSSDTSGDQVSRGWPSNSSSTSVTSMSTGTSDWHAHGYLSPSHTDEFEEPCRSLHEFIYGTNQPPAYTAATEWREPIFSSPQDWYQPDMHVYSVIEPLQTTFPQSSLRTTCSEGTGDVWDTGAGSVASTASGVEVVHPYFRMSQSANEHDTAGATACSSSKTYSNRASVSLHSCVTTLTDRSALNTDSDAPTYPGTSSPMTMVGTEKGGIKINCLDTVETIRVTCVDSGSIHDEQPDWDDIFRRKEARVTREPGYWYTNVDDSMDTL